MPRTTGMRWGNHRLCHYHGVPFEEPLVGHAAKPELVGVGEYPGTIRG